MHNLLNIRPELLISWTCAVLMLGCVAYVYYTDYKQTHGIKSKKRTITTIYIQPHKQVA